MDKSTFLVRALWHLDENLMKKLERIAERKKVSVISLVRTVLIEWLEQEEAQEEMSAD